MLITGRLVGGGDCVLSLSSISSFDAWTGAAPPDDLATHSSYSLSGTTISQQGFDYTGAAPSITTTGSGPTTYTRYSRTINMNTGGEISTNTNTVTAPEDNAFQQSGPIMNTVSYHRNRSGNGHIMGTAAETASGGMTQATGPSFYAAGFDTRFSEAILAPNGAIYVINGDNSTSTSAITRYTTSSQSYVSSLEYAQATVVSHSSYIAGASDTTIWVLRQGNLSQSTTTTAELLEIPLSLSGITNTFVLPSAFTSYAAGGIKVVCDKFCVAPGTSTSVSILNIRNSFSSLGSITLGSSTGANSHPIGLHHVYFPGPNELWRIAR